MRLFKWCGLACDEGRVGWWWVVAILIQNLIELLILLHNWIDLYTVFIVKNVIVVYSCNDDLLLFTI